MFENAIRNFEIIERWGVVHMHRRGNVGDHSHRVAIYTDQLCDLLGVNIETRMEAVRYALWHDVAEVFTGDLPSPVKPLILDHDKHHMYEDGCLAHHHVNRPEESITRIVRVADLLDAVLHLVVEKRMGNQMTDDLYNDLSKHLLDSISALRFGDTRCDEVRTAVVNAIGRHTYMPLQPFPR
jgi:5'-deoxynucleotidase YfbR-like HD superfamily hydrolase